VNSTNEHRPLQASEGHISRVGKVKRFRIQWRVGRQTNIPTCCLVRLCFDMARLDGKTITFKESPEGKRGAIRNNNPTFVPCGIFHHRTK